MCKKSIRKFHEKFPSEEFPHGEFPRKKFHMRNFHYLYSDGETPNFSLKHFEK